MPPPSTLHVFRLVSSKDKNIVRSIRVARNDQRRRKGLIFIQPQLEGESGERRNEREKRNQDHLLWHSTMRPLGSRYFLHNPGIRVCFWSVVWVWVGGGSVSYFCSGSTLKLLG